MLKEKEIAYGHHIGVLGGCGDGLGANSDREEQAEDGEGDEPGLVMHRHHCDGGEAREGPIGSTTALAHE